MSLFDSASLVVTPNGYKEDKLYSIKPTDGSGDLVVTRATTATRVNSDGLIEQVPYNLLKYSQQFTNAIWTPRNGTFTDNFTTAPNGTTTACKWVATDTDPYIYQSYNGANIDYTATCWVKATGTAIGKNCSIRVGASAVFTAMTGEWQQLTITANINGSVNVGVEAPESATSGEIVYIWGFQLVSGTSAKEYFPTTDRLDVPRLDYTNSSCPSILVEPQRTNVLTYSEQFDNADWTKTNVTITANSTIAPSGLQNADTIASNSAASANIYQVKSASSSTTYTASVFVKKDNNESRFPEFVLRTEFTSYSEIYVQLNTKTGASTIRFQNGTASKSVESFGDYWRVILTVTNIADAQIVFRIVPAATNVFGTFNPQIGSIIAWGAQLEAGSYATSYIPTIASSVTRNADVISKTGISSLIGQTEGTILFDIYIESPTATDNENILNIDNGSFGNTIYIQKTASSTIGAEMYSGGSVQASFSKTSIVKGRYKCAFAYANNNTAFFVNGVQVGSTDTSCSVPATSRLQLGQGALGTSVGNINTTAIWKERLSNTELAQLTTI